MWISAALTAVQLISGLATDPKKQAAKRLKAMNINQSLAPLSENVQRARGQASATEAPGTDQLEEMNRQAAADQVGAATRTATDSSKVSAAVSRAGIGQTRANQAIVGRTDAFRERGEERLARSNWALSREQRSVNEKKDQVYMEAETAKSNLLGAGIGNLLTLDRDKDMMGFYEKIYGKDKE